MVNNNNTIKQSTKSINLLSIYLSRVCVCVRVCACVCVYMVVVCSLCSFQSHPF